MTCLPYVHIVETSDATKSEVRLRADAGTSALQIGESRIYFIRQTNTYIQSSIWVSQRHRLTYPRLKSRLIGLLVLFYLLVHNVTT